MRQIGFKNFRKFADFPMMDLAPITMFVGENNSGKSTIVKGILAFSDFLSGKSRSMDWQSLDLKGILDGNVKIIRDVLKNQRFYFHTTYYAHLGTFKRSLYNKAKDDIITFKVTTNLTTIEVDVQGNAKDEEAVSGVITKVRVFINEYCISLEFDLFKDLATIIFHHTTINNSSNLLNEELKSKLQNYFNSFDKDYTLSIPISNGFGFYFGVDFIDALIRSIEKTICASLPPMKFEAARITSVSRHKETPIDLSEEERNFLSTCSEYLSDSKNSYYRFSFPTGRRDDLHGRLYFDIEYIYAHAVTQTVIYSAKDTNDYLSRTIHEFASKQGNKHKRDFIIKWMKEFNIGKNFSIKSVGGEAHIVYITNMDDERVNLADKGMGSIQLMVLLFRLAMTIQSHGNSRYENKIVIVEEPEQNLHPSLQSKLADLFYEVNRDYGFRFIIETHSEYLIRRTQIIVGEKFSDTKTFKGNPFKVYYFPSTGDPYDMGYRTTGSFTEPFGSGFYDEAAKMDMEIIRREMNNPIKRRR